MSERKKIAAIITCYYPFSHADVIVTKFLEDFLPTRRRGAPGRHCIYVSRSGARAGRRLGVSRRARHTALREHFGGAVLGKELAVDGVLIIGEHGDYAWNEKGQHLYPRRYFFEQVCGVFATSGRSVPVFSDKHLSWSWEQAKWMYDRARALKVPLMAGSSLPLCYRRPWLEHALDTPMSEALSIAYWRIGLIRFSRTGNAAVYGRAESGWRDGDCRRAVSGGRCGVGGLR